MPRGGDGVGVRQFPFETKTAQRDVQRHEKKMLWRSKRIRALIRVEEFRVGGVAHPRNITHAAEGSKPECAGAIYPTRTSSFSAHRCRVNGVLMSKSTKSTERPINR